jgi:threonine dehydrogenase-like Zn-dependent dehydrogenase
MRELERLKGWVRAGKPGAQIETVTLTEDEEGLTAALQALGPIDAILDLTPPHASGSTHLRCATSVLRRGGRVSMMGFVERPVVPWTMVGKNIMLKGKLMYEREDMLVMVKMLEAGLFPRGKAFVETRVFGLKEWDEAFAEAGVWKGLGRQVVFAPCGL